jgi:hypothetical protein
LDPIDQLIAGLGNDESRYSNQQFSEADLGVLRKAASILRVSRKDLPETLASLDSNTIPSDPALPEVNATAACPREPFDDGSWTCNFTGHQGSSQQQFNGSQTIDNTVYHDAHAEPRPESNPARAQRVVPANWSPNLTSCFPPFEQNEFSAMGSTFDFNSMGNFVANGEAESLFHPGDYDFIGPFQSTQGGPMTTIGARSDVQPFLPALDQAWENEILFHSDTLDLFQQLDMPRPAIQEDIFDPTYAVDNPRVRQPPKSSSPSPLVSNTEELEQDRGSLGSGSGTRHISKSPTGRGTNSARQMTPGSFSSTGSLVIITPPSENESASAPAPSRTPPEAVEELTRAALLGPCSRVWVLPPRVRI